MNEFNPWTGVTQEVLEAANAKGYLTKEEYEEAIAALPHQTAKCKACGNDLHVVMRGDRQGWNHTNKADQTAVVGLHTAFPQNNTISVVMKRS